MQRILVLYILLIILSPVKAQNSFSFNCVKDTTISCTNPCITLQATIPDIYSSTTSYKVNQFSTASCFRGYISPASPGPSANLTIDDRYSPLIDITFPFTFYGTTYTKLAASTNGFLTFDNSKTLTFSHYGILANGAVLSSTTGTPQDLPSSLYDGAIIMGPYHDLDPNNGTSTQQIKYNVVGTAPYRKWILSYYDVPLYTTACLNLATNTHQIVLYETLGIVEVFIYDKEICNNWNNGRSMIGMQNSNKTSAVMAPGRQATSAPWGSRGMNESWRFVPASGSSLFKRVELYTISGSFVTTGITSPGGNNLLDVNFNNICPPPGGQVYVVKSFYADPNNLSAEIIATDTINVSRGEPIIANITPTRCDGGNTGAITVTYPVGAMYEYSLDGGNWQSSNVFTVPVGSYTVRSRIVGSNCISSKTFSVNSYWLDASIIVTPTPCSGAPSGTITIQPVHGTAPYYYSITGTSFQSLNTFTGLAAGSYTIEVRDVTGCSFKTAAVITTTGPSFTANVVNPLCGSTAGSINVNVTSGTAPYMYSISGGAFQASNMFNNLAAGTYNIIVKDATGCETALSVLVNTEVTFTTDLIIKLPTCYGGNDGEMTANVSSGNSLYQYALNTGSYQTSNQFKNLSSGDYILHIKDSTGCIKDTAFTLLQPNVFIISTVTTSATSCASIDGQVTIKANGGNTPYQYSIDNGITFSMNNIFTVKSGTYALVVRDNKGCLARGSATIPAVNNTMSLELGPDKNLCYGDSLTIVPVLNAPADSFSWRPATGINDTTSRSPTVSPSDTIKYYLTAKMGYCERTDSIQINVLKKPVANAGPDTTICFNTSATLHGSATNLSGGVKYLWTPSYDVADPYSATTTVMPKAGRANAYLLQVSDTYGCNFRVYDQVVVTMNPPVPAFAGNDTIASMGIPHQLYGSGGSKYLWSPANVLDNPLLQNPTAMLQNDTEFNLLVRDTLGCVGTSSVSIKVYKGTKYYVPNAFTPNGDGLNDVFTAIAPGIQQTDYFRIFNRWGKIMYETKNTRKGWNGNYSGIAQPPGVYVWIIKGLDINGKVIELKGTVTLIR